MLSSISRKESEEETWVRMAEREAALLLRWKKAGRVLGLAVMGEWAKRSSGSSLSLKREAAPSSSYSCSDMLVGD